MTGRPAGPGGWEPGGFLVIDRVAWTRRGEPAGDREHPTAGAWSDVSGPLATLVADALRSADRPVLVGVAGAVAAGKSTLVGHLAEQVTSGAGRPTVATVGTDGFLLPNAVLAERGLLARKGFPETYDHDRFADTLRRLAAGEAHVNVPVYSHEIFDVTGELRRLDRTDVVIFEGINALAVPQRAGSPAGDRTASPYTLGVFVDAEESDLRAWFSERFVSFIDAARSDATSFYAQWIDLTLAEARALAGGVWDTINQPNLVEHILPTRERADVIVHKGHDHTVAAIALAPRSGDPRWRRPG